MIKAVNKRQGKLYVLAHGAFTLEPGVSFHEDARFAALGPGTIEALQDMIKSGELELSEAGVEPVAADIVPEPAAPAEVDHDALPENDAEALAAIGVETTHAKLDAWFTAAVGRPAVSEALLARITQIS
jgi:hypothetical protein